MNLLSLFFSVWAIEPEHAMTYLPEVKRLLDGTAPALNTEQLQAYRAAHQPRFLASDGSQLDLAQVNAIRHDNGGDEVESGDPETRRFVMVLPLRGPIHRYDINCGPYGTETRARWLQWAEANAQVVGVVIDSDSPGGEGSGMRVMVSQIRSMKKPVVTHVNHGMAASAMYGIAASSREITISGKSDILGSIGTYMEIPDLIAYYKEYFKLPVHRVFATASTEKNRPWLEALKADPADPQDKHYELLRKEVIDPFNTQFIAAVKEFRPQVKDQDGVFNGKVFFGDEAIELGLADGYGTIDTAVQRVRQLAKSDQQTSRTQQQQKTQPQQSMSLKSKLVAIAASLGLTNDAADQETIDAANAELTERGVTNVALVSTAEQQRLQDSAKAVADADQRAQAAVTQASEARAGAETAAAEATKAKKVNDDANSAADVVITKHNLAKTDGETAVQAAVRHLGEAQTQLADLKAKVAELEQQTADDGKGAGATNGIGDIQGDTQVSKEEQEFLDQAKQDMQRL